MIGALRHLLIQTIYAPAEAARLIITLNPSRETGWMMLLLATILNTFAYSANMALVTVPEDFWIPVIASPMIYLTLSLSFTVVMVFCLYWIGRVQNGKAQLPVLVALLAWLLMVQSLADFAFLVLLVFVPMLASLFSMAAGLYGLWILLNFIQVAHDFPSKGKAALTIVLAIVGLMVGFSVFISVIGVAAMGIS